MPNNVNPDNQNEIPSVRAGDPISASAWNQIADQLNRPYDYGAVSGGGVDPPGPSTIAITTAVIPGRSGTTPGGPITCKVVLDESGVLTEGDDVEVKSWVGTDSPDPTGDWSGYIYISQDSNGDWWYHAIDCVPPPPAFAVLDDTGTGTTIPSDGTGVVYIT